jgi:RNA polymerase sigma-70 factor (ECF subfamily)
VDDRAAEDLRAVRAVLAGEREAFADVVRRYERMVASIAWRYGTRRDEIEDVTSEVFLKAYANLHRFRPDHAFATWLYRIAANAVVDRGRRARREGGRAELPAGLADPEPGPGERIAESQRAALVRAALDEVVPRYREALFLVYVEGLSIEESARILGVPEGTVKSRLLRGRRALRVILERRDPATFGGRDALP